MRSPALTLWSFFKFGLVGACFAVINVALLALLVSAWGMHYLAACVASFFLLNFLSYLANKSVTFRLGAKVVRGQLGRYYIVMAASLAVNLLLMYWLVAGMSLHYLVASAIVAVALSVANFFAHAAISFADSWMKKDFDYEILQVSAFYAGHGGGIEIVAGHLASTWAQAGLRVAWCAGGDTPAGKLASGVTCAPTAYWDPMERHAGLPMPIWPVSGLITLWQTMRRSRAVLVHDSLYVPSMVAVVFARLQRKPVILTQHIGELPVQSPLVRTAVQLANRTVGRWMLSGATQVVFIATAVQNYYLRFVRFRRPPLLIPNGVSHHLFYATQRDRPAIDEGISLLFVGRFVEKKGVHLLRACMDIPGVCWTLVGKGPLDPAQWPERHANVKLLGHTEPDTLAQLYRHADLLVLPSVGEGFPLVIQEALACGTPVLVSTEVADNWTEADPNCVFRVDVTEPGAGSRLREAIEALARNPVRLHLARRQAVELAKRWSWEVCAQAYIDAFIRIADSGCDGPNSVGSFKTPAYRD
ncbi:glycosyltransferase [Luteimonas composti]|uniref:Glycosyltransferase n=1 Tax=Luteimonas composti TaxID=398257 RepID=A0ABT6MP57_9GAMM|nr:glycosyltransferase [Luteimonas composti]MDH7452389.1 glycosyltransferase [Luteimonas composti]